MSKNLSNNYFFLVGFHVAIGLLIYLLPFLSKAFFVLITVFFLYRIFKAPNFQKAKEGLSFTFKNKNYELNLDSYELKEQQKKESKRQNQFESISPDGKWIAYVKNYNLFKKYKC